MPLPIVLSFEGSGLTLIDAQGRRWITAADLGRALGYGGADERGNQLDPPFTSTNYSRPIRTLFDRHAGEFTDDMTILLNLNTPGGAQETRVFSPRGCHLIAMLARTERAKTFRRWVLDVLEKLDIQPHDFILEGPIFPIAPILFGDVYLSTFYCPALSARLWPLNQLKKVVPTGKLDGFPVKRAIKAGLCFEHATRGPLVGMDALVWHSQELARKQFGALHDNITGAIKHLIEAAPEITVNQGEVKCLISP